MFHPIPGFPDYHIERDGRIWDKVNRVTITCGKSRGDHMIHLRPANSPKTMPLRFWTVYHTAFASYKPRVRRH